MKTLYSEIVKLSDSDFALESIFAFANGTHKIASLRHVSYDDLVRYFGEPTIYHYLLDNTDGKIQVEWVLEFNGKPFTIYDWKTFDRDYTLQWLDTWSIGGRSLDTAFINTLQNEFLPKRATIKS